VKKVSVCLAAAALLVLCSVLVGTTAGHAGIQGRPGKIAFLRTVGDGPSGLFVTGADGSGPRRLTPGGLDVASYEWVPDGSRIAYLDRQGALRLVRPDGTGRELLARSSTLRSPWVLSWSPDGKAIAVLQRDPGTPPPPSNSSPHFRIVVIPTDGGAPRRLPSGDAQIIDWSPHGDEIVYGDGPAGSGSSAPTGASHGPSSTRRPSMGKGRRHGRRMERTSGSRAMFGTGVIPTPVSGMTPSTSRTRTEAVCTSSRVMPTTSTGSPGPLTGGGFSTAGRIARAST